MDLDEFGKYREDNRFEAKAAQGGLPQSVWETVSAFANTSGGVIVLGIKECKGHHLEVAGVPDADKMLDDFWNAALSKDKLSARFLQSEDARIAKNVKMDHIDLETVQRYRMRFSEKNANHIWNAVSHDEFLEFIGAAKRDQKGVLRPTQAGILMFGQDCWITYEFPNYFLGYRQETASDDPATSLGRKWRDALARRIVDEADKTLRDRRDCDGYEDDFVSNREVHACYDRLRSTWEQAVEEVLLAGVIEKRHQ